MLTTIALSVLVLVPLIVLVYRELIAPVPKEPVAEPLSSVVADKRYGLSVCPEGTGDYYSKEGHGYPIHLEYVEEEGAWVVYVWADISQEDPTHKISLEMANESNRVRNLE